MATFQGIGLNLAIGSGVLVTSILMFTAAVHWEINDKIAPRTWARPKNVIKNVLKGPYYGISWIPWTLSLSFQDMLEGLPGTGTRKDGWSGKLLNCNLDGIVAIKFHALCLRVAIFASCLCIFVLLPVNSTAQCYPSNTWAGICNNITDLTNFEQTTLANIPPMDFDDVNRTIPIEPDEGNVVASAYRVPSTNEFFWMARGTTWRLYVIVLVAWAIFFYCCLLIWNEWIDNLALRRVFYLEHDHFRERKHELQYLAKLSDPEIEFQSERPPFIPHPEIRDTVPNVSLYSALYKLPDYFFSTAMSSSSSLLDRQLASTVEFFDKCVPNQPGYSSAVAAVTILPDATQVAQAWRKWYKCAGRLRRLRFIRSRIRELQKEQQQNNQQQNLQPPPFTTTKKEPQLQEADKDDMDLEKYFNHFESSEASDGSLSTLSRSKKAESERKVGDQPTKDRVQSPNPLSSESKTQRANGGTSSPRMRRNSIPLPTVAELGSVLWGPSEDKLLPKVKMDKRGSPETTTDVETGLSIEQSTSNDGEHSIQMIASGLSTPEEFPFFSDIGSENEAIGSGESAAEISDETRPRSIAPELCFPSIDTRRSPSTDTYDTPGQSHDVSSSVLRKSPESVGLAEEGKLDLFLADDGMEQLSAYCREFASSSAGCCVYGCDYQRLAQADLETLKELEVEAEEMVEDANQALIEARASVNKNAMDIESGVSQGSLIALRKATRRPMFYPTEKKDQDRSSPNDRAARHYERKTGSRNDSQPRRKFFESFPSDSEEASSEEKWKIARDIADESRIHYTPRGTQGLVHRMSSGKWHFNPGDSFLAKLRDAIHPQVSESSSRRRRNLVGGVVDHHIYAVVTFTSRQAAIAARQCTADGSGLGRWQEVEDLPIPPLADSAPWDICLCRRCCRPVTLTINDSQKRCRRNLTWLFLVLFCFLYTIPLSLTSDLFSARQLASWFPGLEVQNQISGVLTGLLYTFFFSVCPFIFKALANFGSAATSQRQAEYSAIRYYWVFILTTAFTGSSLATMITTSGLYSDLNVGGSAQEVLRRVAKAVPTQISATWLNWMLVRILFSIPLLYLFQGQTFFFSALGMDCCARCSRGGGPGGPLPFRIYVDSGVVFLCVVALAPACPLVAPAGMLYYVVMTPVLRWILIFVHQPRYDGGGNIWPLLHDILLSSMIVAQVLLTTMMVLKMAYGPALLAALSIVPTFMFGVTAKDRFLRCYNDAGLVQTSQLDGWDISKSTSTADREDFRKWLVDCHKASYIPICLAGMDSFLTAEPAVVIPTEKDVRTTPANVMELKAASVRKRLRTMSQDSMYAQRSRVDTMDSGVVSMGSNSSQRCALFRRVPHSAIPKHFATRRPFPPMDSSHSST